MIILTTVLAYFAIIYILSMVVAGKANNDAFYRAHRRSPWYMVAFGMVGASISGVTFVSVPGMVMKIDMTYLQTCLGFIVGYFIVAFVLLPLYYRLRLTTIYTYLDHRFGHCSYQTGAWFFLISKMSGAAVRFYVVCIILQRFVLDAFAIPFPFTVTAMVFLIWLYTHRGGIKALVWTDSFQTSCLFAAVILIFVEVAGAMNMSVGDAVAAIANNHASRIFVFDDWMSTQNFWKQFVSGAFIVVVMTGLDQDMMQKNLTCKSLKDAQKDMCSYGFAFVPANLLFLSLGVLLTIYAGRQGIALPEVTDELMPVFTASGYLGTSVVVLFTVGIVAASFSSADSALTALTTSFCVDICRGDGDEKLRRRSHIGICAVFTLFIILFRMVNSTNVIDAIYIMCSYTYGPLLGLFAYGLFTHRPVRDRIVPIIAIASPLLCFAIDNLALAATGYKFGYELLMLNGAITFALLWLTAGASRYTPRAARQTLS